MLIDTDDFFSDNKSIIVGVSLAVAIALIAGSAGVYFHCRRLREKGIFLWLVEQNEIRPCKLTNGSQVRATLSSFSEKISLAPSSTAPKQSTDELAWCRGTLCVVKKIDAHHVNLHNDDIDLLKKMLRLNHDNVNKFIGLCLVPGNNVSLSAYCGKGCLAIA
ncbi:resact receptor-like [Ptychodera flava]|uniref:resact receptor-like n=1 Tax=Ptychodera flava TaxID=63121 RepID=UPI003969D0F8